MNLWLLQSNFHDGCVHQCLYDLQINVTSSINVVVHYRDTPTSGSSERADRLDIENKISKRIVV